MTLRSIVSNCEVPKTAVNAAMVLFHAELADLILIPPFAERSVAIVQNVGTVFLLLCIVRIWHAANAPLLKLPGARGSDVLLPIGTAVVVWSASISSYFVSDDFGHLRASARPLKTIVWENLVYGQSHTFLRPIGFLSLALDYRLFHTWAPGFHITSLLFHVTAVAGLFFLCRELGTPREVSIMTALIYGIMPISAEAIVWTACRFDQIATPAMLWSLYAYARFRPGGKPTWFAVALALFVVALLSKESAYVLPLIVLLLEAALMRPRRFLCVSFYFFIAAGSLLYRLWVFGGIGGYREASGASSALSIHMISVKGLLLRAPAEMLCGLNWLQPPSWTAYVIAGALALALFPLLMVPVRANRGLYWVALGWMFIAPLPAHSMIRIGPDLGNSRELYFASAGMALLVALLLGNVPQAWLRTVMCVVVCLVLACGARHNLAAWQYASGMSRRLETDIKASFPNPRPGTEFIINNLPRSYRGIYFYQTGLDAAVQIVYGQTDVTARRSSDTETLVPSKTLVNLCWDDTNPDGYLAPCSVW